MTTVPLIVWGEDEDDPNVLELRRYNEAVEAKVAKNNHFLKVLARQAPFNPDYNPDDFVSFLNSSYRDDGGRLIDRQEVLNFAGVEPEYKDGLEHGLWSAQVRVAQQAIATRRYREYESIRTRPTVTDSGPTCYSLRDFITADFPEVPWHIDNLVPTQGLGLIAASQKNGKSLFSIQLGLCLAAGIPFMGRDVVTPVPVLYIEEEGARTGIQRRVQRQREALGVPDTAPFHIVPRRSIRIDTDEGVQNLRSLIIETGAKVIIVGPVSKSAHLSDENDSSSWRDLINRMTDLATDLIVTVYLVHHRRKGSSGSSAARQPGSVPDFFDTVRGSNALIGAIDIGIGLYRAKKEPAGTLYVMSREGEDFRQNYDFDTDNLIFTPRDTETSEERAETTLQAIVRFLIEAGDPQGIDDISTAVGVSARTLPRYLLQCLHFDWVKLEVGKHNKKLYYATSKGTEATTSDGEDLF